MNEPIRVLHVDDDPDVGSLAKRYLEDHAPFSVHPEEDVRRALDRIGSGSFDCVVSDYDMPRLDGIEFLREVRSIDPHLPFILVTGKGNEAVASEAISAGVTDYLQKGGPETYEILANRIENAVSREQLDHFQAVTKHDPIALLDRFSDPLFVLDESWTFTYVNEAAANDLFDESPGALVGECIWERFPERRATAFYTHYHEVLESGESRTVEDRYEPRDRWYREHIYPASDGITVVSHDITGEKRRQGDLVRSRELLRHVEELTRVGGWEVDTRDGVVRWTSGTYRIHGFDPEDQEFSPTLENAIEFYHPEDRERIESAVERCLECGEPYDHELRLITTEERTRWVRTRGKPVRDDDGEIIGARGAIQDVTSRRERERQLSELSQFREAIIQSANVWINVLDEEGTVVLWNEAAERISGYPAEAVVGSADVWERLYPDPDYRDEILAKLSAAHSGPEAVEEYETVIRTNSGEERTISWNSHAIHDAGTGPGGSVAVGRDVTERRRDRNELERIRDFFAEAEELGNLGAWEFDADGNTTWTAGTYRIHGLPQDVAPTVTDGIEYIHPEDRPRIERAVEDALDAGESYDLRARLLTAEDETRWVRTRGHPTGDGDAVRGFIQDVTEQVARERELRNAKTQVEAAVEAGDVGTWEWQVADNELHINPAFAERFGVPRDEAERGLPLDRFVESIDPRDRDEVRELIDEALESCSSYQAEYRVNDVHGDVRWVVARGAVQCDENGEPVRFPGTLIDITDRKRSERELEHYREVIENVADPIYVLDRDGRFEMANRALLEIVGYDREELIGEHIGLIMLNEDVERGRELIRELLRDDDAGWKSYEMVLSLRDGSTRITETKFSILVDGEEFLGTVGVIRDITERKAYEEELERQNQRLEDFASIVSHDLRNPLNVADGRLELAMDECDSPHLEQIETALDRMATLIDALLTFARMGEEARHLQPVELGGIAQSCWTTVETGEADLEITADLTIEADPDRLAQLFENLYRNAIEHGGRDVTVTVGTTEDGRGFFVADDGPGIPPGERKQALESGHSSGAQGTGLGLAIVSQIVDAHEWELTVGASASGGARFEIRGTTAVP